MELSNKPFIHLFRTRNQYYFYDANTCSIKDARDVYYQQLYISASFYFEHSNSNTLNLK